ncbi:unnamed protein product [Clonostachys solani]|uniref:Minor extracellular protease vpr n=1 Tax=Clonostachys solani TaxID=160281 RepID=A0A9N9Z2C2_9HYPO|nr:unnamed protein product [Clonostachys solani]
MYLISLPLLLVGVAAVAGSPASNIYTREDELPLNTTNPVGKSFIVEFSPGAAKRRDGILSQDNIEIVKTFDSSVFQGASVKTDTYTLEELQALPDVSRVWPNTFLQLEPLSPEVLAEIPSDSQYTTHNSTGVSKLHNAGIFGEGVKIGVVDTGIYYTHPALGGCFGDGCKVAQGYDFVGDGYWPSEERTPDDDPLDQQGHGTHVAGIIAGDNGLGWTGVAPKATLYAYKVFSLSAGTTEDVLIEAFLKAFDDGVDIITSSIGGTSGWSDGAWAVVASRLVDEGVIVTISAGNSGTAGTFFGSSGSSGNEVIAVASVETETFPATPFSATFSLDGTGNTTTLGYIPATYYFPTEVQDWPVVVYNFDTTDPADGCEPYPEDAPKIEKAIPIVRRGTCTFATKQANLQALGANYILVYNNENPLIVPGTEEYGSLFGLITAKSGEAIIETIKAGGNVTVDFTVNPEQPVGLEYPSGGRPNDFTSWGGTYTLQLKPDIAGPGGNILSTYPEDAWAVLSGTSMACPYIAGVAALYIGAHGGRGTHGKDFGKWLSRRIIASGTALPWYDGKEVVAPVFQVGNGLIDAFKVVKYTTDIQFDKIALNDTRYFSRYHDITVKNEGDKDVSYKLSYQAAAGVEAAGVYPLASYEDWRLKSLSELVPIELEPKIYLPRDFTLKPGESKTVSVSFDNPDKLGWNAALFPLYSGKIIVTSSLGEQLSVPYAGLGADLKTQLDPIWRVTYPFSKSSVLFTDIKDKPWYTFGLSVSEQDFPKIYAKIKWGTSQIRWDIFEAGWNERNWKYPPIPGENGYIGPAASWVGAGQVSYFNPAWYDPNETFTFPEYNLFRNAQTTNSYHEFWWFGKLGNGSQIELGKYTMRFAALKPFGNPEVSDQWDVFQIPNIEVRGKYTWA